MKKIPTAEEFKQQLDKANHSYTDEYLMVEFAKLHVQAALEEALESIPCLGSSTDIPSYEEVEDAVLNCYSLDKIK